MSAIASPPSAIITAISTRTRPRSWTGTNDRQASAPRELAGQAGPVADQTEPDAAGVGHHAGPTTSY